VETPKLLQTFSIVGVSGVPVVSPEAQRLGQGPGLGLHSDFIKARAVGNGPL